MLLFSSLGMVVGNITFIVISKRLVKWYYLLGIITSVLNHGNANTHLFIYLDRSVMAVGAVMDIFYMDTIYKWILWSLAIKCYFISKLTGNKYFHVGAHFFVTILHNLILSNN